MLATMLSTSASSTVQQLTREPQLCIFIDILRMNYCVHFLNFHFSILFSIKLVNYIMLVLNMQEPNHLREKQILLHL